MNVIGLHRLPFDAARFEADLAKFDETSRDEMREQLRENHENAWIVVVESDGEIDFDLFAHPERGADGQAAWMEQVLSEDSGRTRGAFFLHYVDPAKPIWYGKKRLAFPKPTPPAAELLRKIENESPD